MNSTSTPSPEQETPEIIICKNCDHSFSGKYCSNCGQSVKELERPIRFMIADFMGTIITFDTRLVKTLTTILFKPGRLTIDYIQGKRARYMPPFRFYLFISFVMFLLISNITSSSISEGMEAGRKSTDGITSLSTDSISKIMDVAIEEAKEEGDTTDLSSVEDISEFFKDMATADYDDDDSKYARAARKVKEYPELYTNKLYQFASWGLFLFMPLFAFLLWMMFWKSRPHYIGHLIFALNIHSFIFTLVVIVIACHKLIGPALTNWTAYLFLLVPLYQTIGARQLYRRKWRSSFFRLTFVWMAYVFILIVGLIIIATFAFVGI
jgi:hypothetical protein